MRVLAVNPGATSTKFAVFAGIEVLLKKTMEHQGTELSQFHRVFDQVEYRMELILAALREADIALDSLDAVVGRGGLLKPLQGGTYRVNAAMLQDLEKAERGEHASNLGGVLAYRLASRCGANVPAFIVDPVSVDELEPVARISGFPGLSRVSMAHALNMKAVARKVAAELGKTYGEMNLVVAHLGTGVSLAAHYRGRMIDIVDGKEEGPFAPDRSGGLPASQLVRLCFSGQYTFEELKKRLFGSGGIYAYLGTKDIREVEKRAAAGEEQAEILLQALCYQVAKEIGALSTVLSGQVDRIILTGGMAYSKRVVEMVSRRVQFIAPVAVVPGEEELESLAAGALRVLNREEEPHIYQ
ncbi:MAG TPA: butyrate kinase [Patescibacteria group bacterium]|nr:butyrate kinase [Patescibacteria group bacterium]